jgi:RNA polymerase sigma-70 factor (ECF subfamily)
MDDRGIIKLFFDRDESALTEAEKKYNGYCHSIAYGILGDRRDSEECVNDAMLGLWNTIPPKKPENLRTYLAKLTRNFALNRYKMRSAEKRGGSGVDVSLDELEGCLPSSDNLENIVDSMVLSELLNSFLGTLKAESRIIFVQKYWYFRSVDDIARDLSVSKSKVKVSLMRTRARLAEYLEGEGYNSEKG